MSAHEAKGMERHPLGGSDLQVTRIGLGLAALGRPAYIDLGRRQDLGVERGVEVMQARCHAVLDAAAEAGIGYVDAARSYGEAERFLAAWLAARPEAAPRMTVGSKWGYTYVARWRTDAETHEVKDHSLEALRRQSQESMALLGGHLVLYQIHSATLESGVLEDRGVLDELSRLRDEHGLVIGLSVSGPRQGEVIRRALAIDGDNPFSSVQATWNPLEPSVGAALADANASGWGVIVKEAMANGRLAGGHDASIDQVVGPIAERHATTPDVVALAAALANAWVDVVLSGAVTPAQVRSNAEAVRLELDDGSLAALSALATEPESYWSARAALPWT
jgi:aryl-alcohol dehydrogenase-like predicted oxidoreductase